MVQTPRSERTNQQTIEPPDLGWLRRLWVCVLSLIFPGLGQAVRGAYFRAFIITIIAVLAIATIRFSVYAWPLLPSRFVYVAIVLAALAVIPVAIFAAVDAFRFRTNRASRYPAWWRRWLVYLGILAVLACARTSSARFIGRHFQFQDRRWSLHCSSAI